MLRGPGESYSDVILRLAGSRERSTVKTGTRDAPATAMRKYRSFADGVANESIRPKTHFRSPETERS